MRELEAMELRPSQYNPGDEIPEKSLAYRFAKKYFFNDFGAYKNFKGSHRSPVQVGGDNQGPDRSLVQIGDKR